MLLALHAFDGRLFLLPDIGNIQEDIRLPLHLFGLVRLEQVKLRRAQDLFAGVMPPGLGDHAAFHGHLGGVHVIGVVGVIKGMTEHKVGLDLAHQVDQLELGVAVQLQRIIAGIHKLNVMGAEGLGGGFGFTTAGRFDLIEGHIPLLPELRRLAAFPIGQADDGHRIALFLMQGDGAAATPDKVGGMGADHQNRFLIAVHESVLF